MTGWKSYCVPDLSVDESSTGFRVTKPLSKEPIMPVETAYKMTVLDEYLSKLDSLKAVSQECEMLRDFLTFKNYAVIEDSGELHVVKDVPKEEMLEFVEWLKVSYGL